MTLFELLCLSVKEIVVVLLTLGPLCSVGPLSGFCSVQEAVNDLFPVLPLEIVSVGLQPVKKYPLLDGSSNVIGVCSML